MLEGSLTACVARLRHQVEPTRPVSMPKKVVRRSGGAIVGSFRVVAVDHCGVE